MRTGADWIRNVRGYDKTVSVIFASLTRTPVISFSMTSATSSTSRDASDSSQINASAEAVRAVRGDKQPAFTLKEKEEKPSKDQKEANRPLERKRRLEELVAAADCFSHQRRFKISNYEQVLAKKCPYHPNGNHSAKDCFLLKKYIEQQIKGLKP
uniref:Uncharacterized protein n=1 Tax=Leersia perrieri TaxID=77586 RepID=A0A0D9V1H9_9ORYZ